uniref:Ion transport domain-containing protein n=1 Tax=Strongyloides stercoralis TaxID=6248 RepID=A0A0K0E7F4_STRER
MENIDCLRKQSLFTVSHNDRNIKVLSEISLNNPSFSLKSNNSISEKIPNQQTNFNKINKNCYPNIVPFDKINYSRLHPANGSLGDPSKNILYLKTKFQNTANNFVNDFSKIQTSNNSVDYTQNDVDKILKAFLESKQIHSKDTYFDEESNYFSNKLFPYSKNDVNEVINKFLSSKTPVTKVEDSISINQESYQEPSIISITKSFLDSKTKFKEEDGNYFYIFDYEDNILNKNVLKKLQNSKCKDLIKHPYVMNFIEAKLINQRRNFVNFSFITLNFLILLYFGTIISPPIFKIIGGIEIILYLVYFFLTINLFQTKEEASNLSFSDWFERLNFITTTLYTKILIYAWYSFIHFFNEYHFYTNILLGELSKNLSTLLFFSILFSLVKNDSSSILNRKIKKMIVLLVGIQRKWLPISIIIVGLLEYILFIEYKNYYNIFPNFLKASFWLGCLFIMTLEFTLTFLSIILSHLYVIGDYKSVKYNFKDTCIEEKLFYCIESLEIIEKCTYFLDTLNKYCPSKIPNILIINKENKLSKNYYGSSNQPNFVESCECSLDEKKT